MKNLKTLNNFVTESTITEQFSGKSDFQKIIKALDQGKKVYADHSRFPGTFRVISIDRNGTIAVVDYEDGKGEEEMAAMNINPKKIKIQESVNEGRKAKSKTPNEVITIDVDLAGDDKDIMDALKKFKIKVKANGATPNSYDMMGRKKDILDYLQSEYYALDARDVEDMWPELLESDLNEEYVESMDSIEIANALGKIKTLWDTWKAGPATERSDIKPAQKELKGWMDNWFKQNIK